MRTRILPAFKLLAVFCAFGPHVTHGFPISRRDAISVACAYFSVVLAPRISRSESSTALIDALLQAIASGNDSSVFSSIDNIVATTPSRGKASDVDGTWQLLWSYKADKFSPLLQLPRPFKPDSFQYFGATAAQEVGDSRVAQGLTGGILGDNQLWLSSGTIPLDDNILEIQPPFRLQLGGRVRTGVPKKTIVDSGSDADFRSLNGRTAEAQAAPKNKYAQLFIEGDAPGSLRVSKIVDGDPEIVGAVFVHRKL